VGHDHVVKEGGRRPFGRGSFYAACGQVKVRETAVTTAPSLRQFLEAGAMDARQQHNI
jgi:hypothetical protein